MFVRQTQNLKQDLIIIKVHKREVSQQRLNEHYGQHSHNGVDDWQFTLIE